MDLRITAGSLKGRIIHCPEKKLFFRPTLERVRISIADMLGPLIAGSRAADLCAGSGSFGFEMLSRGALSIDFVENDRRCVALISGHAEKFGVAARCRVVQRDAAAFAASCTDTYDIIFFDPPYGDKTTADLIPQIRRLLSASGILLFQRSSQVSPGAAGPEDAPFEVRKFGDTAVALYRRNPS